MGPMRVSNTTTGSTGSCYCNLEAKICLYPTDFQDMRQHAMIKEILAVTVLLLKNVKCIDMTQTTDQNIPLIKNKK